MNMNMRRSFWRLLSLSLLALVVLAGCGPSQQLPSQALQANTPAAEDTTDADTDTADSDADADTADTADTDTTDTDADADADTDADTDTDADADTADTAADADTDADADTADTDADPTTSDRMQQLIETTRHFKGDPDAPVTIIEFSDFQCPYCSRFASETAPQIDEQFVDEGIVRVGYRHAAYQGEGSVQAAAASECAADQDAFWDYYDRLVERLAVEGKRDFNADTLKSFAAELDLDTELFNTCIDEGTYLDLVQEETQETHMLGIGGTPSFLVNGTLMVGAQPFENFVELINAAKVGANEPTDLEAHAEENAQPSQEEFITMVQEETRHFKGDPDAPVTIIEFSDFQCPYCSRFAVETAPQLEEEYIDKGLVRFGYRHAAYHEGEAYLAAEASECAADQDAFWDYHDLLIDQLANEGDHSFPAEVLKQYAADLDLDTDTFNACLDDVKYAELVRSETSEVQGWGVTGTPTFLVNDKGIVGAQPFSAFEEIIEAELE